MGLKITLKPGERLIVGGAVVTNGATRCSLMIENRVPILREKEILSPEAAHSPARRIYFAVQLMYIDAGRLAEHHSAYWRQVREFLDAAPSALGIIERISNAILVGDYYQALKCAKKLIAYEEEILARAS